MKLKILGVLLVGLVFFGGIFVGSRLATQSIEKGELPPLATPKPTPLARYAIDTLANTSVSPAQVTRGERTKEEKEFSSYQFSMKFDPTLSGSTQKTVSGLLNIPSGEGPFPLIVMLRGYVDPSIYSSGVGTRNGAEFFASQGFLTIAPDFLGYAQSDTEAGNIFESRFQTYTTALTLLNSIATPEFAQMTNNTWDGKNIEIWAHSNGGQIALTTLAITGEAYPTVLWAPVTKPFPYSVLYYTDESVDGGKLIRRELSKFEDQYDVTRFTFTNYLDRIHAPLQFNQGTADDAVPFIWTRTIASLLKKTNDSVTYHEYPGSDHNLRPAWNAVIESDLQFFKKWLQ